MERHWLAKACLPVSYTQCATFVSTPCCTVIDKLLCALSWTAVQGPGLDKLVSVSTCMHAHLTKQKLVVNKSEYVLMKHESHVPRTEEKENTTPLGNFIKSSLKCNHYPMAMKPSGG